MTARNLYTVGASLLGLYLVIFAALAVLAAFSIGWGFLGVETGVWIDGCPDVVDAYVEAHGACPAWWKDVYFFAIPPALFASAAYIGLLSFKFVLAKRPNNSIKPTWLRHAAYFWR